MSHVQCILQLFLFTFHIFHVSQTFFINSRYAQAPLQATWGGNTPNSVRLPSVACPSIFSYEYANDRGWYGFLKIPKFGEQNVFNVEVNMTINRLEFSSGGIHLELLSNDEELRSAPDIRLILTLPYQDFLPKLTQIKINDRIICVDNPEPVLPGQTKTGLWTRLAVKQLYGRVANNPQLLNYLPMFTPPVVFPFITHGFNLLSPLTVPQVIPVVPQPTTKPKGGITGFLSGLAGAMKNMFNVHMNGDISGGYAATVGDFHSEGGGKLSGGLIGNPFKGFGGGLGGEVFEMDGNRNYGMYRAANAGIGGTLTEAGLNVSGGVGHGSAPFGPLL